jgi:hypothetical protein
MTDMTETDLVMVGRDPDEWALARVARSVAGVCERRGWDVEVARELLGMLGVDDLATIKKARTGLRASRYASKRTAPPSLVRPAHRTFHLRERAMPVSVPVLAPDPIEPGSAMISSDSTTWTALVTFPEVRVGGGLAAVLAQPDEPLFCKRGHELSGANVIRRPDKPNLQCRECTNARKRGYRARNTRWESESKGGRNGSSTGASSGGVRDVPSAGQQSVVAASDVGVPDVPALL